MLVAADEDDAKFDINEIGLLDVKYSPVDDEDPFGVSGDELSKIARPELIKRHAGVDGARSKKVEDNAITGYNAFDVVAPPHNLKALAKLYERSAPHKAAVDAKTTNIAALGYDFVPSPLTELKMDSLKEKSAERFQKRLTKMKIELNEFTDSLNEDDEFMETLEKVWKDFETTGNGYIEVGRSDETGRIGYLGHLHAVNMRIRKKRDGFVQLIENKAVFFRNFGKDDEDPINHDPNPNEVIHLKNYSPTSTYYGVPDIVSADTAIAGNDFSSKFNLDYFENKAVPRHVITLQGATINPKLTKNLLEFFETGLKGENHRSLFVPLPGSTSDNKVEFDIKAVEAGTQDASFNNYRKGNLMEILMAHRVPINKVGLPEGVSLAVARDADKTFKEQVTEPRQNLLEKKLNKIFKEIQGEHVFNLKLNELTLTDEATQSQIDERRIKTGVETPNEQRVRRGLPRHPNGDELVQLNAKHLANEARAQGNRERDARRSAGATDSAGEGRNEQGAGRTTE